MTRSEEFDTGYRMQHRPSEQGPGLHEMDQAYPGIHDHPDWYTSGTTRGPEAAADRQTLGAAAAARGKPDASVTMYRAAPAGVGAIHTGDWVTTSKSYAQQHAKHPSDPSQDMPVYSATVRAEHLRATGDHIHEFGYSGPDVPVSQP